MRHPLVSLALSVSLAVLAACGGGTPAPEAPATPATPGTPEAPATPATPGTPEAPATPGTPAATPAPTPAPTAAAPTGPVWSDSMSKDEKVKFMKVHIMPAMEPAFQKGDPKKYAEVTCKTCHGPAFKDPDDFLPRLTMKDGKLTSFADKPEVSKYMAEIIVPAMAKAMGMQPYDPATQKGFGCAGCHAIDMK